MTQQIIDEQILAIKKLTAKVLATGPEGCKKFIEELLNEKPVNTADNGKAVDIDSLAEEVLFRFYPQTYKFLVEQHPVKLDCVLEAMKIMYLKGKGEWISVETELPKEFGRYWCYVEEIYDLGKGYYQLNCAYDELTKLFSDNFKIKHVTHWMPLPTPPAR